VVESTALEMRRAGNGTVGSNPTLSATDPAHKSLNRVSACNRPLLPLKSWPFGSGSAVRGSFQAAYRAPVLPRLQAADGRYRLTS
jgi:hypothetical protein